MSKMTLKNQLLSTYIYMIYDKEYKCFIGFESASGTASGISESLVLGLDFKMQAIRLT